LLATAGIDDGVEGRGHVRLTIAADGRTLFDGPVAGGDPPLPLDLDLAGATRLSILVDYGEGFDVSDHLDLGNARLVR
jgi:hypothetical protein